MRLELADFPAFFAAVNDGRTPFPWQVRFLAEAHGRLNDPARPAVFPSLVDLPTGSGKTSLIDIAVFLLALDAHRPLDQRRMPRRIVFVVDRRVVVDQANEHATELARALVRPDAAPVVAAVADALRTYSAVGADLAGDPLVATVLRGGVVRDETWARRPDTPAIISSTVDQVGSRLLFRGYGLSSSMRPIHAGLLGSDTLFLLDEVHLSRPFAQTLRALASEYQSWAEHPISPKWEVVELSATPGADALGSRFELIAEDRDPKHHPVLPRRLAASKPVRLASPVKAPGDRGKTVAALAKAIVREADQVRAEPHIRTVGVVVNRVDLAVAVHALFRQIDEVDTELVTGRMRPFDRDQLMAELGPKVQTGRVRTHDARPLVVVGTQCIEAGADLDFDAIVTEVASIDALVQRFGRMDRDGELAAAGTPSQGVIVVASSTLKAGPDAIYGGALRETWAALEATDDLDFGIERLAEDLRTDQSLRSSTPDAPLLFPGHLDSWVQTEPVPVPDPDPRFWLHGPDDGPGDVTIVWRADLDQDLLARAIEDDHALAAVRTLLVAAPPGAIESMTVPLAAARAWLAGLPVVPVSDVEAEGQIDMDETEVRSARPFVKWAGDRTTVGRIERERQRGAQLRGTSSDIRPGDVLVVPSSYGGVGEHRSWDPSSDRPVTDLAERTQLMQRRRAVLRLVPAVLKAADGSALSSEDLVLGGDPDQPDRQQLEGWLRLHADELGDDVQRWVANRLLRWLDGPSAAARRVVIERVELGGSTCLVASAPAPDALEQDLLAGTAVDRPDTVDSEPETSSFTSVAVGLDRHLEGVAGWAEALATNCGLARDLIDDIRLAGRLHDLGKVDPRFQDMLSLGNPLALVDGPLAKSELTAGAFALRRAAQERAGYPTGARHEVLSLAMIEGADEIRAKAHDWDLVQHLVASHHGWCRPFAPAVVDERSIRVSHAVDGTTVQADTQHGLAALGAGIPERFWRLVRRYGWHRLAWFEAILRLADHRQSEAEQQGDVDRTGRASAASTGGAR